MGMGQQNLAHFHSLSLWIDPDDTYLTMRGDASNFVAEGKYFITIGHAQPTGEGEHVSIGTELANIVIVQCVERLATRSEDMYLRRTGVRVYSVVRRDLSESSQLFGSASAPCNGSFSVKWMGRTPQFVCLAAYHMIEMMKHRTRPSISHRRCSSQGSVVS